MAVFGAPIDSPSVPLHHSSGVIDKFGHNLAEAFRTHRGRDVHGVHDVGEQHRHLLVLRRSGGLGERRTALTAELRYRIELRAARPTRHSPRKCIATVVHVSIVSPLVRPVCNIAPGITGAQADGSTHRSRLSATKSALGVAYRLGAGRLCVKLQA
jgi:hypothetical protein